MRGSKPHTDSNNASLLFRQGQLLLDDGNARLIGKADAACRGAEGLGEGVIGVGLTLASLEDAAEEHDACQCVIGVGLTLTAWPRPVRTPHTGWRWTRLSRRGGFRCSTEARCSSGAAPHRRGERPGCMGRGSSPGRSARRRSRILQLETRRQTRRAGQTTSIGREGPSCRDCPSYESGPRYRRKHWVTRCMGRQWPP
jgi:hypothetical protein